MSETPVPIVFVVLKDSRELGLGEDPILGVFAYNKEHEAWRTAWEYYVEENPVDDEFNTYRSANNRVELKQQLSAGEISLFLANEVIPSVETWKVAT